MARRRIEEQPRLVAGKPGAQPLGFVSARYESGGRGVGFISSGRGDPGGRSYGIHQLSGAYSMGAFLRSPEGQPYRKEFFGLKPQTPEFNQVYRTIAQRDPQGFADAQHAFYTRTHFNPVESVAKRVGFDTSNRGVQESLFSMSVQHGRAASIVARAAKNLPDNATPQQQIAALYDARSAYVSRLSTLPESTRASVLNRYQREVRDSLAAASMPAAGDTFPHINVVAADGLTPGQSAGAGNQPLEMADPTQIAQAMANDVAGPNDLPSANRFQPRPQAPEQEPSAVASAPAAQDNTLGSVFGNGPLGVSGTGTLLDGWQVGTPILGHVINRATNDVPATDQAAGKVGTANGGGLLGLGKGGGSFKNPIAPASVPSQIGSDMASLDAALGGNDVGSIIPPPPPPPPMTPQDMPVLFRRRRRMQAA